MICKRVVPCIWKIHSDNVVYRTNEVTSEFSHRIRSFHWKVNENIRSTWAIHSYLRDCILPLRHIDCIKPRFRVLQECHVAHVFAYAFLTVSAWAVDTAKWYMNELVREQNRELIVSHSRLRWHQTSRHNIHFCQSWRLKLLHRQQSACHSINEIICLAYNTGFSSLVEDTRRIFGSFFLLFRIVSIHTHHLFMIKTSIVSTWKSNVYEENTIHPNQAKLKQQERLAAAPMIFGWNAYNRQTVAFGRTKDN